MNCLACGEDLKKTLIALIKGCELGGLRVSCSTVFACVCVCARACVSTCECTNQFGKRRPEEEL